MSRLVVTMVSYSKLAYATCQELAHPWTRSCLRCHADMLFGTWIGTTFFFSLHYLFGLGVTRAKKKAFPEFKLKKFLEFYARILAFGVIESTGAIVLSCLFRKILGRYYWFTLAILPATISGLSVSALDIKTIQMYSATFVNMTLQMLTRELEQLNLLKWNAYHKTVIFMFLSSLLSVLLSYAHAKNLIRTINIFWYFGPFINADNSSDDNTVGKEKNSRVEQIFTDSLKYFTTGASLMLMRIIFRDSPHLKTNPKLFFLSLINWKNYKLAALLGLYAAIYQTVRCYLFYLKQDKISLSAQHAIAGALAGLSFLIQPNLTILYSALISVVQVANGLADAKGYTIFRNWPHSTFFYAICNGILFHYGLTQPEVCPRLMIYIMSTATHCRSDFVSLYIKKYLER